MMSLEVKSREQQSSSANYNYFDGDKIRDAMVSLYLQEIVTNRSLVEQLSNYNTRNGKNWWKMIESTANVLSTYGGGFSSASGNDRTLTSVISQMKLNVTGAFKFDLAAAILAVHLVFQLNGSVIPVYIKDVQNLSEKVFSFYSTVYTSGLKGVPRQSTERKVVNTGGDSGDNDVMQQIDIVEKANKVQTVQDLKDNFKVILRYIASLQESLTILHQTAKTNRKDEILLPHSRYYTHEEMKTLNDEGTVLTNDGRDYFIVPKYSVYRILTVAWIYDILHYQTKTENGLYIDFTTADIFINSGYFTNFKVDFERFKGFMSNLIPGPEYIAMIEHPNDEQVTQNMFKKAFIEMKKYANDLIADGNDMTLDIDVYENDHMSLFRDFFCLLSSCEVGNKPYKIYKVDSDMGRSREGSIGFVISVLGSEFDCQQPQKYKASAYRVNYNKVIPLAADVPEHKFDMEFWSGFRTVDDWFAAPVGAASGKITNYGVPIYGTGDMNELYRQVPPIIKDIDTSSCRAILQDGGKGKYTDVVVRSIYMALHQDILKSFSRLPSSEESILYKIAMERLKEIEEYSIFRDLAPRKITPGRSDDYPLHRKIKATLESTGDYRFKVFKSPMEDIKNITRDIGKVKGIALRDTISDILALSSGYEYESLMKYSLHTAKDNSILYTHIKRYAHEMLRRYVKFLFTVWEANSWNFAAEYESEDKMFHDLQSTLSFQPVNRGTQSVQSVRVLHLLSKPFIINTSVGDLYENYGIPFVGTNSVGSNQGDEASGAAISGVNIMSPVKNDVEMLLAQVPSTELNGESYTVLLSPTTWISADIDTVDHGYSLVFPAAGEPGREFGISPSDLPAVLRRKDIIYVNKTIDANIEKRGVKI